ATSGGAHVAAGLRPTEQPASSAVAPPRKLRLETCIQAHDTRVIVAHASASPGRVGPSPVSVTDLWRTHSCVPCRHSCWHLWPPRQASTRVWTRHARVRAPQPCRINNFNRGLLESVLERASARSGEPWAEAH